MSKNQVYARRVPISVAVVLLLTATLGAQGQPAKPRIAVFSGQLATIQHGPTLITSNKAREKYNLPLQMDRNGQPLRFDSLRAQRLAAPVTVYIEAFTAHPLEKDMRELYAPPDGYVNPQTGAFSRQRQGPQDKPVYEVTLRPEDGLYMLPYMARQVDGSAWEGDCTVPNAPLDKCRGSFYPDASRTFEEVDRFFGNPFSSEADFDFYRAAPPGGYRKGLPHDQRTDVGEGDIPPEVWGRDFFMYGVYQGAAGRYWEAPLGQVARVTNVVQKAMDSGRYAGGIFLEGSANVEDSLYWLSLVINTTVPLVGNSSQSGHGTLTNDGNGNIVSSVDYIRSGLWKDARGLDAIGGVIIQEKRIITAREVQKTDARAGGYLPTGGHGGFVGSAGPTRITFLPTKKHTHTSDVNMARLPRAVQGVRQAGGRLESVQVPVKDGNGELLASAIPMVATVKYVAYGADNTDDDPATQVEIAARVEKNLRDFPLAGFIIEGQAPYGNHNRPTQLALMRATLRGMPVVKVGRGNNEGFTQPAYLMIGGGNLTATKARLLLMAAMLKFGSLPVPANPDQPTDAELKAIQAKLALYQAVFDTH